MKNTNDTWYLFVYTVVHSTHSILFWLILSNKERKSLNLYSCNNKNNKNNNNINNNSVVSIIIIIIIQTLKIFTQTQTQNESIQ